MARSCAKRSVEVGVPAGAVVAAPDLVVMVEDATRVSSSPSTGVCNPVRAVGVGGTVVPGVGSDDEKPLWIFFSRFLSALSWCASALFSALFVAAW